MDYLLLINKDNNIISEDKIAVLLEYLSSKEVTLYLYATTASAWRQRIVPIVQWVTKNQEDGLKFKLKVKVMDKGMNAFQREFLEFNKVERIEPSFSKGIYIIDSEGLMCLDRIPVAQIYDDRIESKD